MPDPNAPAAPAADPAAPATPVTPAAPAASAPVTPPAADPAAPAVPATPAPESNVLADPAAPADPAATDPAAPIAEIKAADYQIPDPVKTLGFTAEDPTIGKFFEKAAELKLPQDAVAALMETVAPQIHEQALAPYKAWKELQDGWAAEVKADPDYGGAKLPGTVAMIRKGMELVLTAGAKTPDEAAAAMKTADDALRITGAGNNPAIFRLLAKTFERLSEGGHVGGNPSAKGPSKSAAELLFDKTPGG